MPSKAPSKGRENNKQVQRNVRKSMHNCIHFHTHTRKKKILLYVSLLIPTISTYRDFSKEVRNEGDEKRRVTESELNLGQKEKKKKHKKYTKMKNTILSF